MAKARWLQDNLVWAHLDSKVLPLRRSPQLCPNATWRLHVGMVVVIAIASKRLAINAVSRYVRPMSASGVRRGKAARSSGCKTHPATAPAGSNQSSYGGDEIAEAFG
jgi:hypothetical protein